MLGSHTSIQLSFLAGATKIRVITNRATNEAALDEAGVGSRAAEARRHALCLTAAVDAVCGQLAASCYGQAQSGP